MQKSKKKHSMIFEDQNDGRQAGKEVFRLSFFYSQLNARHSLSSLQQCIIQQLLNSVFRDVQTYQGLTKCFQPQNSAWFTSGLLIILDIMEKPQPMIMFFLKLPTQHLVVFKKILNYAMTRAQSACWESYLSLRV